MKLWHHHSLAKSPPPNLHGLVIQTVKLDIDNNAYLVIPLVIPHGRMKDLEVSHLLDNQKLHAPLAKNQQVGTVNFWLDGKTIERHPLVVLNEVKKRDSLKCITDYIKLKFNHWFN